jgi:hypothetical protein
MSRKLQSQIQDIKGLPGKFKRILLAWASFANNDGKNIFPAKETVAERAGVSRWTIYDNSNILEAADVLQRAGSHMCKTERCNKGGTHWTSRHGHYTTVYKINVALLGNPTLLLQRIAEATVAKSNSGTVGKTQPVTVGKPDTTQAVKETPAPHGNPDSSVLTDGLVGKSVSEGASFASLTTPLHDQEQERTPYLSLKTGRSISHKDQDIASQLYMDLLPHGLPTEENIVAVFDLAVDFGQQYLRDIWFWNKRHKTGGLRFRSIQHLATALRSESENNVAVQFAEHDFSSCPKCKKLRTCAHCGKPEDGTGDARNEFRDYVHRGCKDVWSEFQAQCGSLGPMAASAVAPEGTRKGFDHEEAE